MKRYGRKTYGRLAGPKNQGPKNHGPDDRRLKKTRSRIRSGLLWLRELQLLVEYRWARTRRSAGPGDAAGYHSHDIPDDAPENLPDNLPDNNPFGRFLRRAGGITDPDRDDDLMAYWLVTRRMSDWPMPEALESAYFRFRGRRRRDTHRARRWRALILEWANLHEEESTASDGRESGTGRENRQVPEVHDLLPDSLPVRNPGAEPVRWFGRIVHVAATVVLLVGLGTWTWFDVLPSVRSTAPEPMPPGIGELERGSRSLVEEALRVRYIDVLHEVHRTPVSELGAGLDFERALLEGARLDVEQAIERHERIGRPPVRLLTLYGKISLLTGFEEDGRRALARAANRGGPAGADAIDVLATLSR